MLTEEDFLAYMPDQLPLVANEYVILKLEKEEDYPKGFRATEGYFKNVLRFDGESKALYPIKYWRREGSHPPNNRMATYYDALNDETIETIIATGDGGVGKTFTALTHAIGKVESGEYQRIVVITTLSSKLDCGAIPGKLNEKLDPIVSSCKDAIRSYLESSSKYKEMRRNLRKRNKGEFEMEDYYETKSSRKRKSKVEETKDSSQPMAEKGSYEEQLSRDVDNIFKRCFEIAPYETIQGRNFNDSIVFLDELQRVSLKNDSDSLNNIVTMLTRSARNSKMIITGDYSQIPRNNPEKRILNGLNFATQLLKGSDTTAFIHLTDNLRNHTTALVFENLARVKEKFGLY
jgi:predicted ribonuclease YlaK